MSTITQKCPRCQKWCECDETGFAERAKIGMENVTKFGKSIGGTLGGLLGKPGKFIGETIGSVAGGITGSVLGTTLGGAVFVDSYYFKCPSCGHEWSVCSDLDNKEKEKISEIDAIIDSFYDKWDKCEVEEDYNALIPEIEKVIEEYKPNNTQLAELYEIISCAAYMSEDLEMATNNINRALELSSENSTYHTLKGLFNWIQSDENKTLSDLYEILKDFSNINSDKCEINLLNDEHLKTEFENLLNSYVENFSKLPESKRRYIFFKERIDTVTDDIKLLPLKKDIPGLVFPASHPRINTLYILHPLKSDTYLPYNSYEYELFRDQLMEFTRIMEHLGAKHISYHIIEERTTDTDNSSKKEYGTKVNIKGAGVSGDTMFDEEQIQMRKLREEFTSTSSYFEMEEIKMPDPASLIWYHYNKDWQYKVESRLSGRKHQESFIVSTFSEDFLDETEKMGIEAEVNYLLDSVKGKAKTAKRFKFHNKLSQQWKVDVEFYPLKRNFFKRIFS